MNANKLSYKEMMALRSAYNQGVKTAETRAAANQYILLRKHGKLQEFKAEQAS